MWFPENSYLGKCQCGTEFMAPKGTMHCHSCLYKRIAELVDGIAELRKRKGNRVILMDKISSRLNERGDSSE